MVKTAQSRASSSPAFPDLGIVESFVSDFPDLLVVFLFKGREVLRQRRCFEHLINTLVHPVTQVLFDFVLRERIDDASNLPLRHRAAVRTVAEPTAQAGACRTTMTRKESRWRVQPPSQQTVQSSKREPRVTGVRRRRYLVSRGISHLSRSTPCVAPRGLEVQ